MKKLFAGWFVGLFLVLGVLPAAVSYPPPTEWKGITYFPRYHSFWRMLYEWDDYDSRFFEDGGCGGG